MVITPAMTAYYYSFSLGSKNVCLSGVFDMFLLVSVVLTDFLTTALISRCHYLAVWMEGCLKASM